jgi:hypothetical protein
MRLQTEYMSFKNRWTISSSYHVQAHLKRSQRRCFSQTALLWFEVLPELSAALPDAPRLVVGAPWVVTGAPSYSEGRQECPPTIWYSPEIDASKFTLHILSDTPGGFQWLKYILLMHRFPRTASKWCICKFSQWAGPGAPPIMLDYHLRPDWVYVYIDRDLYNAWHMMM